MNENLTTCERFEAAVQRVLDGELPPAALAGPHADVCPVCCETAAAVVLLLGGLKLLPPVGPSPDFADRVVPAVVRDRRRIDAVRSVRIILASLAAVIVVAVLAIPDSPTDRPSTAARSPAANEGPPVPPSVMKSFADARSAVVSLTRRATQESLSPARNLFASLDAPRPEPTPVPTVAGPTASPVEPITNTAKRALNLFIRDVGGLASLPQQKS